jgi:hypothetical protein
MVHTAMPAATGQEPPLRVRIAVHFGAVLEDGEGIHGADIHTAHRLQSYAEPGCIIVSRAAAEAPGGPLPGRVLDLGPLHLRHISQPVQAFSVRLAPADQDPLPILPGVTERRASVAVLPFRNLGGDKAETRFADGMAEAVVYVLAGLEGLMLISRGSTHPYGPDASPVATAAATHVKHHHNRRRPSQVLPALFPPIPVPGHASYPSGHATQAWLMARCLKRAIDGSAYVDLGNAVDVFAARVARNREIAGLHYRSDSVAGKRLAEHVADVVLAMEVTQPIIEGAQGEWR